MYLGNLHNLKAITLRDCKNITEGGIHSLRQKLRNPDLAIEFSHRTVK